MYHFWIFALLIFSSQSFSKDLQFYKDVWRQPNQVAKRKESTEPNKPEITEVCYEKLGCFSKNGTFKHMKWLPDSPKTIGTKFALYTKENTDLPVYIHYDDENTLNTTYFHSNRLTKIICHGFTQSGKSQNILKIKDAILQVEDVNFILVDWANGAALPFYLSAAANTEVVGRQTALLIHMLKDKRSLNEEDIHIIGFSLGSHLAGFIGKTLRDKWNIMLGRITGLDPASPFFEDADESVHLSWKDAAYVDIIHTSAGDSYMSGDVGMVAPIGHIDFYPNGGTNQPGCKKLTCNHRRAMELFIHSVLNHCDFQAFPCDSYEEFKEGKCFSCGNGCNRMGYYSNLHESRGNFFLVTRDSHPFCGRVIQVVLESSKNQTITYGQIEIALIGEDQLEDTITLTHSKDHKIQPGSHLSGLIAAHDGVFPIGHLKITYTKYRGWFSDGNHEWNIDSVGVIDQHGLLFLYCSSNTTLITDEATVLNRKEC